MNNKSFLIAVISGALTLNYASNALFAAERGSGLVLQRLAARQLSATATPTARPSKMNCPQCKDALVSVPVQPSQGMGAKALVMNSAPVMQVSRHLCSSCQNDWHTVGQGKAKKHLAIHKCTTC